MANFLTRLWEVLSRRIDSFLLGIALAIVCVGFVTLFSASDQSLARLSSQATSLAVALVLMWLVANIPPQTIARAAVPLYVVGIVALVGVALFGITVNGSKRWLNLGVARFQPSELMKIALPLMLAWYFQRFEGRIGWRDFALAAALIVVPVYLIKRQPDLGTALLIAATGFYVLFLAGLSWKIILGLVLAGSAAAPLVWQHLHGYQRERILTFLDPARDPLGAGYHSSQASIALGSGGVVGKGWLNGTQTHLDFLPERHTDFVFAVFGEEFGLIGNVVLLLLYLLLIGRAMVITANASTLFARLIAGAVTLMFFTCAFVNMGMVSGILPVVGVPLPLISYGGTALISLFIGLGLLMSVQAPQAGQHLGGKCLNLLSSRLPMEPGDGCSGVA
jgi:rod shape determining protein RodA